MCSRAVAWDAERQDAWIEGELRVVMMSYHRGSGGAARGEALVVLPLMLLVLVTSGLDEGESGPG